MTIELDPKYAAAYYNRGLSYYALRQHGRAIQDFDKAIELDPKDAKAYYNKACAYALMGDPAKACDWLSQAIDLDPKCREMAVTDTDFDFTRNAQCFRELTGE